LIRDLKLELARGELQWELPRPYLQSIVLIHTIPITRELTEHVFATAMLDIHKHRVLVSELVVEALGKPEAAKNQPLPS
jgi:hypothetical protein